MQTVLLTPTFERQAQRAGLSEDELQEIVAIISGDPTCGVAIPGTGGARKVRHAGRGKGKSGGYRTIHFFGGDDAPIFLLALIDKGERADLTAKERNDLATLLPGVAEAYRRRTRS